MKWVLRVVVGLVGLVAVVALIGALFPREHVATSTVTLRQPPDTVWKVVRDPGSVTASWSDIKQAERVNDPSGREVWRLTMKNGYQMPLVVEQAQAPSRMVTRIDSPPGAPFGGMWTYEIAPADAGKGSRVSVTERGWIANPIFRFMARMIFGYYGTLDSYLKALGKKFGEDVKPVHES